MTEIEWAWAAGFFEGEGCISLDLAGKSKAAHVRQPRLTVVTTDRDVLERFVHIVGVGDIRPYESKTKLGKKDQWKWRIGRHADVEMILVEFYDHLGKRRKEKADEVISYILNVARSS